MMNSKKFDNLIDRIHNYIDGLSDEERDNKLYLLSLVISLQLMTNEEKQLLFDNEES